MRFLFGVLPDEEPLTEDERRELLMADRPTDDNLALALRTVVANQILDGEPPEVWQAAQRMSACGIARDAAMDQLTGAVEPLIMSAVHGGTGITAADYLAALERLPLPDPAAVEDAYLAVVREHVVLELDGIGEPLGTRLGIPAEVAEELAGEADEYLMAGPDGPLVMLAGDFVVHAGAICVGSVLTHRLTAEELAADGLVFDSDLAPLQRATEKPHVGGVELDAEGDGWYGNGSWLAGHEVGGLVAVRVDGAGGVDVAAVAEPPEPAPELLSLLRGAYDAAIFEPGLPVESDDLVFGMLVRDRAAFAQARRPLTELAEAAGLEQRGEYFAHDEEIWAQGRSADRHFRFVDSLGSADESLAAMAAFDVLADESSDAAALREALTTFDDPEIMTAVVDELLEDDDPEAVARLDRVGERLRRAATSGPRAAAAGWVSALAAERAGRVLDAEAHLREAGRHGAGWPVLEDRIAWYEFDRGDAAAALARWRALGISDDAPEAAVLRGIAGPSGPELGRNEPCWCGSGRKYKQCHRGQSVLPPLPERMTWLVAKTAAYVWRRGGIDEDIGFLAERRLPEDPELAFDDPLAIDVLLHEGGWFDRFLVERGPLLPADEALLAASWALVDRTVYEVLAVRTGDGVTMRDLRTGDRIDVTDRVFSASATVGGLVCARAVPDGGDGHRFVGGVLAVPPGAEQEVLRIVEARAGAELLSFAAAMERAPEMLDPDGDPIVLCEATLRVPADAAGVLDKRYSPTDGGWVWLADAGPDGDQRAQAAFTLDGDQLTVNSITERRMDRVLADLRDALPGAEVRSVERGVEPRGEGAIAQPPDPAVMVDLQDRFERRWCEEQVPALGGRTPREAVADPTRRAEVERLIASFPEVDPATGVFGLRPHRLMELLGLPPAR